MERKQSDIAAALIGFLCCCSYSMEFSEAQIVAGNETDRLSLLAFKAEITSDPLGVLISWNRSIPFCLWPGVTCGRRHQRVTELRLNSTGLNGGLSPHIGNLSFLKVLDLRTNNLSRLIPQELGRLYRLEMLQLRDNIFSGEIPVNISRCLNLQVLDLADNDIKGRLPAELGMLSKLRTLAFHKNNIFGDIPLSLGNASLIETISGALNSLTGAIPKSFGQLKKLTFLGLGANNLTGVIPSTLLNSSSLSIFSLSYNGFEGTLPLDLGLFLPNIISFKVASNRMSGTIPPSIINASTLISIQLGTNHFSGKVPSLVGLNNLEDLSFDENNLGDGGDDDLNFLSHLVNCSNLEALVISDNNFGGLLPEYISNFSTSLKKMGFGRNQIRGTIPRGIGNLAGLNSLGFESNQLTGTIPSSLGNLQELGDLFLNINNLSGTIPFSLGNLTTVQRVNLRLNHLEGNIPASLGNWKAVQFIYLSQNKLSGTIPKEIMSLSSLSTDLYLSDNLLTGSIPIEVGKLVNLGTLDLSNNQLSDEIPAALGDCISLESLQLQGNSFQGPIPESLSSLRALQSLDLSQNNLSGRLPTFLGKFRVLQYLNLSFNDLEGSVPMEGVFNNISSVSLDGNRRLCGGIPALELPPCMPKDSKEKKSQVKLGLIIGVSSGSLLIGLILTLSYLAFHRSKKAINRTVSVASLGISYPKVTYRDLFNATDGFALGTLLGRGSFGSVYKGVLDQGEVVVAVKVLNLQQKGALKSFIAECEALRSIKHRNLVEILTVCSSTDFRGNDFKALVYEFMENGSLENWLHPVPNNNPSHYQPRTFNVKQRLSTAIDVATALDYLHNQSVQPIVHCDLKPSNILLDADMTACVGDFGLARLLTEKFQHLWSDPGSSTGLKGSIGYAAPEYAMGNRASTQGDVYSYGILLLEMFTGKRPTDELFQNNLNLRKFVMMAIPHHVTEIVDPELLKEQEETDSNSGSEHSVTNPTIMDCVLSVLGIGIRCSSDMQSDRMDIKTVVNDLHHIRVRLL